MDVNASVTDPVFNIPVWEISDVDGSGRARWELDSADLPGFDATSDFRLSARLRVIGANRDAGPGTLLEVADRQQRYVLTLGKFASQTRVNFLESTNPDLRVGSANDENTSYIDLELLRVDGVAVLSMNGVASNVVPHTISNDTLLRVNFGDGTSAAVGGMYLRSIRFEWGDLVQPCSVSFARDSYEQSVVDSFPSNVTAGCPQLTLVSPLFGLASLTSLTGLSSVEKVIGNLAFDANSDLPDRLLGWPALKEITGGLRLIGANTLTEYGGFDGLQTIRGRFEVNGTGPERLVSISGFSALNSVETIEIFEARGLRSITAFSQLHSIPGAIFLDRLPLLSDISGLSSLIEADRILLFNNDSLSDCSPMQRLLDNVDDGDSGPSSGDVPDLRSGPDGVLLAGNATGCNTLAEIVPDTDGDGLQDHRDAFPDDFDNDGSPDNEDAFPEDPSESRDSDGDGIGNNRELELGTNPNAGDSDGDGFSDPEELDAGTNPIDAGDIPMGPGLNIPLLKAADARTP
ncbi:MAG: hypothetical protein AAGI72_01465 [Pseudomonadota bacterium]